MDDKLLAFDHTASDAHAQCLTGTLAAA